MRSIRYFLFTTLVVLLGLSMSADSFAQKGPGRGRGDKKRPGDSTEVRPDSLRPKDGKRDSTFRGGRPEKRDRAEELIGYFMHNDSCRDVLLSQMSADDAAAFTRLLGAIRGNNDELKTLRQQLRAAKEAGDTAAFRRISEQLREMYKQIGESHKMLADLLGKYKDVAMRIRTDCGGRPPKGPRDGKGPGDRGGDTSDKGGDHPNFMIAPNPVPMGGTAMLTLKLSAETNVAITILDQNGAVLTIPAALLPAGEQQVALNVSSLPRGAYIVQVQLGDRMQVLKLMIN